MKIRCAAFIDVITKNKVIKQDIHVEKDRITRICAWDGGIDESDYDLRDKVLLPGFVDAHNHLCFDLGDEVRQIGEPPAYQALVAAKNARYAINSGVTTLREAGERNYVDFSVKRGINEGLIPGPRIIVAGPGLMRTGGHMWFMGNEVDGIEEARKGVRLQLREGVDFIKIFVTGGATSHHTEAITPEMTRDEVEVLIQEAHAAGKRVGAHAHGGQAATWAIESGVDAVEHGCFLTESQLELMKEKGTILVSTSGIQRAISDSKAYTPFMREKAAAAHANYLDIIGKALAMKIPIALGNDTNHGHIAEEIEFLVRAGACPADAIYSATYEGAKLCELDAHVGSIEVGKLADFVVLDGDPLEQIKHMRSPSWVFKAGEAVKAPFDRR